MMLLAGGFDSWVIQRVQEGKCWVTAALFHGSVEATGFRQHSAFERWCIMVWLPEEGPVCYRRSESRYGDLRHPISPSYVVSWNLEYLTPPCTPELMHHPAVCSALLPLLPFFSFCWSLYPGADSSSACDPVSVLLMQSLFGLCGAFLLNQREGKGREKESEEMKQL